MKQRAFRQNKTGVAPPLKSPSPATGTSGHEYELYHVNYIHIAFAFARWVCDLPGEICCFLRPAPPAKTFSKKFPKSGVYRVADGLSKVTLAERERTTEIPHRKGVRRWIRSPAMTLSCGTAMTHFARRYSAMRPKIICMRWDGSATVKSRKTP